MEADSEILEIDRLEDELDPLPPEVAKVRELISTLELCHHKAARWVDNIIGAIGLGATGKGLGTRAPGPPHPAEELWQAVCAALSAWCAGCPAASCRLSAGSLPASRLLAGLGRRGPLKEWQVNRVIDKIRSLMPPPAAAPYPWMLFSGGEAFYVTGCPEHFKEHEDFWLATARTLIHDTEDGRDARLPLGLAIDMLWPCHWRFLENLQIVLDAIGGNLEPQEPFAACSRNIGLLPLRHRMEIVSATLKFFCGSAGADNTDPQILARLGSPTPAARWLAASLDKTIRLQLDPPAALRAISALTGPDWI